MSRTLEELHHEFGDELRGLLMESFAEANRSGVTKHAANGAMMYEQLCRAKQLLNRIHAFYSQPKALGAKAVNGNGITSAPAQR